MENKLHAVLAPLTTEAQLGGHHFLLPVVYGL